MEKYTVAGGYYRVNRWRNRRALVNSFMWVYPLSGR